MVHLLGGAAALVGATIIGSRTGKFDETGKSQPIRGHSVPVSILCKSKMGKISFSKYWNFLKVIFIFKCFVFKSMSQDNL